MKIALTFLIVFSTFLAHAQPCHEVNLRKDSLEAAVLSEYIRQCHNGSYFYPSIGIGIVDLVQYMDVQDRKVWRLSVAVDDGYKGFPPTKYDIFGSDLVLIYDADSKGNQILTPPTQELLQCLDEIIGDRVYIRPLKRDRWIEHMETIDNKRVEVKEKRDWTVASAGSPPNTFIVTFNKDGTFTKVRGI